MSEQIDLLRDGLPFEVVLMMAVVAVATVALLLVSRVRCGEGLVRGTGVALSVLGLIVAGYVVVTAVIQHEIPQCVGGGGGCGLVENSSYSRIAGVHVSILGLAGYLLVLASFLLRGDLARLAGLAFTVFGFGFSLYLTYLELWDIKAICQWCMGSAVLMTLLFVVALVRLLWYYGLDPEDDPPDPPAEPADDLTAD